MRVDEQCKVLCRIESLSAGQAKAFRGKIEDDYRVNMCAGSAACFWGGCNPKIIMACALPRSTLRIAQCCPALSLQDFGQPACCNGQDAQG